MPLGMLLLLFCQRQRKDKLRTNAFRADTVDIFSMCLDDFFYNGKAEPGAAFVPATGEVCLVETLPDFGDAVFRNTHTIVFDGNIGFSIAGDRFNRNLRIKVGKFDGIVDQIIKHLLDLSHIGMDTKRIGRK